MEDITLTNELSTTSLLNIIYHENGYTCYETLYDDRVNTFCLALDEIIPFTLEDAIKERVKERVYERYNMC